MAVSGNTINNRAGTNLQPASGGSSSSPPPSQPGSASSSKGTALVPVNAPFGGSQGYTRVRPEPYTTVSPTQPQKQPDVVTGKLVTPKAPTAERVEPEPGNAPAPKETSGPGGRQGLIIGLGIGLIVVNAAFGNNAGSLLSGVWYKPDKQSPTTPVQNFFPIIGEVIFLVILVTISRFSKAAESLVLTFLIGLWLLWAMFRLPAAYKAGIPGLVGNLFSGAPQPSGNQAESTSTTSSSVPAKSSSLFGQPYAFSVPRQGGSFVGTRVPHHSHIMG